MSAPVKTKSRSITKADIEYSIEEKRKWPYTQNIIDIIRCSVCFDSIEDLIDGINKFKLIIDEFSARREKYRYGLYSKKKQENSCCITKILRVKNGFVNFKDKSSNSTKFSDFNYQDVKFNVLIEYCTNVDENGIATYTNVIGEIQFLLSFMLTAKKMGHSIYSFNRKQELFDKLYNICDNDENVCDSKKIDKNLRSIILTRNMVKFSLFCQTMNKYEKEYIVKNYDMLDKFMKDMHWNKARKLLKIVGNRQTDN